MAPPQREGILCPSCGAALNAGQEQCPLCRRIVPDPSGRFDRVAQAALIVLCAAGAVLILGATAWIWLRAHL